MYTVENDRPCGGVQKRFYWGTKSVLVIGNKKMQFNCANVAFATQSVTTQAVDVYVAALKPLLNMTTFLLNPKTKQQEKYMLGQGIDKQPFSPFCKGSTAQPGGI
ncbi:hypothetical protein AAIR98_000226 [Elusimicrobium simillimum]|uniref:hypothetical protein n=1 Tax=Elusimicrobium simillimum TaxID=3143438 RepID=UPI003C6FC359